MQVADLTPGYPFAASATGSGYPSATGGKIAIMSLPWDLIIFDDAIFAVQEYSTNPRSEDLTYFISRCWKAIH